jgi:hypothetical protein
MSENSGHQSSMPVKMTTQGTFSPLIDQHDVSKIEKFKTLFDAQNLSLGTFAFCMHLFVFNVSPLLQSTNNYIFTH